MGLALQIYDGQGTGELRVFRDWKTACVHLCDHVLTWPEAGGWALVLPTYGARVSITHRNERYSLAKNLWRTEGESGQWLYDEYAQAATEALDTAQFMGWSWPDEWRPGDRKALGLSGVLVIFSADSVRSVMLPGLGSIARVVEAEDASHSNDRRPWDPLPREAPVDEAEPLGSGHIASYGMRRLCARERHEAEARARREEQESFETRRFRLFRKCAQFVRSEMFAAYIYEREGSSPPEDLRKAVKDFHEWVEFGRSAGGHGA